MFFSLNDKLRFALLVMCNRFLYEKMRTRTEGILITSRHFFGQWMAFLLERTSGDPKIPGIGMWRASSSCAPMRFSIEVLTRVYGKASGKSVRTLVLHPVWWILYHNNATTIVFFCSPKLKMSQKVEKIQIQKKKTFQQAFPRLGETLGQVYRITRRVLWRRLKEKLCKFYNTSFGILGLALIWCPFGGPSANQLQFCLSPDGGSRLRSHF